MNINVLVTEDSDTDARRIETLLRYCTHVTCTYHRATDLASTLSILNDRDIDIVILDPGLPDADGLQAVSIVAKKHTDLPIVVITGADSFEAGRDCIKAGAQEYLAKDDLRSQSLERVIVYAMERRYAQVQVQRYYRDSIKAPAFDAESEIALLKESVVQIRSLVSKHAPHILPRIDVLSSTTSRPKMTPVRRSSDPEVADPRVIISEVLSRYDDER